MPRTESKKMYILRDVWDAYVAELLENNPSWWTKYNYKYSWADFSVFKMDNHGHPVEVINFIKYRDIMKSYFTRARKAIIDGEAVNIMGNVGKICARRVQRDFRRQRQRMIDWPKTKKQPLVFDEVKGRMAYAKIIYFTTDDWCRIGWHKTKAITNERVYEFLPSKSPKSGKGFKREFSIALQKDPLLGYQYLYQPVRNYLQK